MGALSERRLGKKPKLDPFTLCCASELQGPEAVKQFTEQMQHAAAELGEDAEPLAQRVVDEQLQPTAQYLAQNLEPEVAPSILRTL